MTTKAHGYNCAQIPITPHTFSKTLPQPPQWPMITKNRPPCRGDSPQRDWAASTHECHTAKFGSSRWRKRQSTIPLEKSGTNQHMPPSHLSHLCQRLSKWRTNQKMLEIEQPVQLRIATGIYCEKILVKLAYKNTLHKPTDNSPQIPTLPQLLIGSWSQHIGSRASRCQYWVWVYTFPQW